MKNKNRSSIYERTNKFLPKGCHQIFPITNFFRKSIIANLNEFILQLILSQTPSFFICLEKSITILGNPFSALKGNQQLSDLRSGQLIGILITQTKRTTFLKHC